MADAGVALVTGSTRGIGWATARALADDGFAVVLNGHSSTEQLEARTRELEQEFGTKTLGLLFDVADPKGVADCYRTIHDTFGRLDVVVANAGVMADALIGMIRTEDIDRALAVNVGGAIHLLQGAARLMTRKRRGSIVLVSSVMALRGNAGQAVYSSSKSALVGLTLSAAKELSPRGVRVNAVAPGVIETDLLDMPEDTAERLRSAISLGRFGTPEEVATVIRFLSTDHAAYVTGQVIGVDGGISI